MSTSPRSLIVVGAGIAGLTLACACSRAGMRVDVIERAAAPGDTGAGIQLSANAVQVLDALDLKTALQSVAVAPEYAVLRDYRNGRPLFTAALNPEHERRYGQPYLHIHRADLHGILMQAACDSGARVHFGQHVASYESGDDHVTVRCEASTFRGQVVAGADGIRSIVRQQAFGKSTARFTGQTAWRGLVDAARVPADLIPADANAWLGPGRHFVTYYVRNRRLINFVAVREQADWTEESWRTGGNVADVLDAFGDWDTRIATLLDACDECYQWGLHDHPALERWHHERAVLLGDACHPMLPFMAQGAAMAIEDAWVLSRVLNDRTLSLDAAFERYQRTRLPRTSAVQALSTGNARRYHLPNGFQAALRNLGFRAATALPLLARRMLDPLYGLNVTAGDT